jgi:hypothetical protein
MSPSNESVNGLDIYGDSYHGNVAGQNATGGAPSNSPGHKKNGKGKDRTRGTSTASGVKSPKPEEDDSESGSGKATWMEGGGSGVSIPDGPTKDDARSIVMNGMKQYLGREASKKEVNNFFKKFSAYSEDNLNSVGAGAQDEFMQDWIEGKPKLRKEYAQTKTATSYMNALDRALGSVKEL